MSSWLYFSKFSFHLLKKEKRKMTEKAQTSNKQCLPSICVFWFTFEEQFSFWFVQFVAALLAIDDVNIVDKRCETAYFSINDYAQVLNATEKGSNLLSDLLFNEDGYAFKVLVSLLPLICLWVAGRIDLNILLRVITSVVLERGFSWDEKQVRLNVLNKNCSNHCPHLRQYLLNVPFVKYHFSTYNFFAFRRVFVPYSLELRWKYLAP